MANTYAGEVAIAWQGRDYLFRPTLAAIGSLGTPRGIVDILRRAQKPTMDGYVAALAVLSACYVGDPDDINRLIGHFREVKGQLRYVLGSVPAQNVHVIGARLAVAGIVGDPKPRKGDGNSTREFDPAEFVGAAQAHLGMSSAEAWQMTMIEFQRAMDAKFPDPKAQKEKDLPTKGAAAASVAHVIQLRDRIRSRHSN